MRPLRFARFWQLTGGALLILAFLALVISPDSPLLPPSDYDKVAHAIGFFGLTLWFAGVCTRARFGWLLLAMLLFGALTEWVQAAMTRRTGDPADFAADLIGIVAALAVALLGLDGWPRWIEHWIPGDD